MSYLNFKAEMRELASTVEPADQSISPEAQRIGAVALLKVDQKYGEKSESPLSHHATPHSIGVTRRDIQLINLLYPYITEKYRWRIYDLAGIVGAVHDVEQDKGPGENERISGQYGVNLARRSSDQEIASDGFTSRIRLGVNATLAVPDDLMVVRQPNVGRGEPDPIAFTTSFADRNASAMEGTTRMIIDVTNLAYEWFKHPTVAQYKGVIDLQDPFIKGGMNDDVIKPQLEYYFPGDEEKVFEILKDSYNPLIRSTYKAAMVLKNASSLEKALVDIVRVANPKDAVNVALEKLGNIIH